MNRRPLRLRARNLLPLVTLLGLGGLLAGCSGTDTCEAGLCGSGGEGGGASPSSTSTATTTSGSTTQSGNPTSSSTESGGGDGNGGESGAGGETGSGGGGGDGEGGAGAGGDGGAGGGGDLDCTPEELGANEEVPEACGVFVDLGFDGGTQSGTPDEPYDNLAAALVAAARGTGRVYVCGREDTPLQGPVVIEESVQLYGGWGCNQWTKFTAFAGGKTEWTADAGDIPLTIEGAGTTATVQGFAITSATATAPGDSSIAVMIVDATVEVLDSTILAGDGAAGATMLPTDLETLAPKGNDGLPGCNNALENIAGQSGGQNTCGGVNVRGGSGGAGLDDVEGASGTNGQPSADGGGAGGVGETADDCDPGEGGDDGVIGPLGAGATSAGALVAGGFQPAAGNAGTTGTYGRGGGGGGGANACTGAGPSGAGGGAGGCGGPGGGGGGGGGASIGIAVVDGAVTVARSTVNSSTGGAGGVGARGGTGQPGGLQGTATAPACPGGSGGNGGEGGSGGGGRGGHSIAIARTATATVNLESGATLTAGTAGLGGAGGDGITVGNDGGAGLDGVAMNEHQL